MPVEREDERHCLVGHFLGAHTRRVRENDAIIGAGFNVDVVEPVRVHVASTWQRSAAFMTGAVPHPARVMMASASLTTSIASPSLCGLA